MPELFVIHKLIAILHFLTLQTQSFSSLISTLLCTLSYILYTVCQTFGVLTSTRPPVPCFPSERDCSVLLNSPSSVADNKLHILTVQWMFRGAYTQDSQVYILYDLHTLLVIEYSKHESTHNWINHLRVAELLTDQGGLLDVREREFI